MAWLLLSALVIIWIVFLLPIGGAPSSPAASVEDFEKKMDLLAETNSNAPGRWVLVPKKGHRFLGPRDRERARVRRRRRLILTVLAELTVLTLIIGAFPPLRPMLFATAIFGGLLFLYVAVLAAVRQRAAQRASAVRRRRPRQGAAAAGSTREAGEDPARSRELLLESGVRISGDDVHVVVREEEEARAGQRESRTVSSAAG